MMPYTNFRKMSDEDVQAVVAYMNTLPPARSSLPKTQINFPVSLLIKGEPRPAGSVAAVDRGDRMKYGEYLVTIGGCADCHTKIEKGGPVYDIENISVVSPKRHHQIHYDPAP